MFDLVYTMFGYSPLQRDDIASLLGKKPSFICVVGAEHERAALFDALRAHQIGSEALLGCVYGQASDEKEVASFLSKFKVDTEERRNAHPLLVLASAPLTFCLRVRLAAFAKKRNALGAWLALSELSQDWDTLCLGQDASEEQVAAAALLCGRSVEALQRLRYGAQWLVLRRDTSLSPRQLSL